MAWVGGWVMRNFPLAEGREDGRMIEHQGEKTAMHVCVLVRYRYEFTDVVGFRRLRVVRSGSSCGQL